ncbi:hypothetical protein KKC1_21270 [Calderihabitans maritimus]|uniref:Uncharacterized protein n=1 Tax=Calderihabitans maritimus TaxID=1246530 RepID=A0A1Z5HTY0_9FIRM|nr:hypothetical protein KKC1_21270 [Calderihabitans maritimus]
MNITVEQIDIMKCNSQTKMTIRERHFPTGTVLLTGFKEK